MKDKIFHFFGNFFEQSPVPTPIKLEIAFKLDMIIFFISKFRNGVLKTKGEKRISENFMKYIFEQHIDKNKTKIEILKKNLDHKSKIIIDAIIKRQEHVYTHNILDLNLLTPEEKRDQWINIYNIKKKYKGLGNYYGIENFYFHCGLRFISNNLLKKYEDKDFIDAGAANGDTPAIFSKEYSFKKIYAFEPEINNYKDLILNIKRFKLDNVIPIKKALGSHKKKLKITNDAGQSYINELGKEIIDVITIDQFVKENKLNVGVIKMDIEGFEYNALIGAIKTIKKFNPILLISIYHGGKDFFEIKPLIEKIGNYKLIIRKLNPHHFFFDTMLICIPK